MYNDHRIHGIFYNPVLGVTHGHFCCVPLVTQAMPGTTVKGLHQDVNSRWQGSLGAAL